MDVCSLLDRAAARLCVGSASHVSMRLHCSLSVGVLNSHCAFCHRIHIWEADLTLSTSRLYHLTELCASHWINVMMLCNMCEFGFLFLTQAAPREEGLPFYSAGTAPLTRFIVITSSVSNLLVWRWRGAIRLLLCQLVMLTSVRCMFYAASQIKGRVLEQSRPLKRSQFTALSFPTSKQGCRVPIAWRFCSSESITASHTKSLIRFSAIVYILRERSSEAVTMSTSNNSTVPSCSAHVSAGQYSVTAQSKYDPSSGNYYKVDDHLYFRCNSLCSGYWHFVSTYADIWDQACS